MHGFRDNEVLLLTGYDVIVSLPLGGVSHTFLLNLKEWPQFHNHGSLTYISRISYRFEVIRHVILAVIA